MTGRAGWTMRAPLVTEAEVQALRTCWLPLMLGTAAVDYETISDSLLLDMFAQNLHYGPHLAELQAYIIALSEACEQHTGWHNIWLTRFRDDLWATYGRDIPEPRPTVMSAQLTQLPKLGIDDQLRLPRKYDRRYGTPYTLIEVQFLEENLAGVFENEQLRACLMIIVGLILLQYAYLPRLLADEDPSLLYAKYAGGRNLLRDHNAFCRRYGLPELFWATDARLNSVG